MTTSTAPVISSTESDQIYATALIARDQASQHMYNAELALHVARQARVDVWIAAAYDRLHEAVLEHNAAGAVLDKLLAGTAA